MKMIILCCNEPSTFDNFDYSDTYNFLDSKLHHEDIFQFIKS